MREESVTYYGLEFVCTGCGVHVWTAVHVGEGRECAMCSTMGAAFTRAFNARKPAGRSIAANVIAGPWPESGESAARAGDAH